MAVVSVEKRLVKINNILKSLKEAYPTIGSNVIYYIQESQEFDISGTSYSPVRIRFTPRYKLGGNLFIKLTPYFEAADYFGFAHQFTPQHFQEIQDGQDYVDVVITEYAGIGKLKIFASGISPGTFARIA